ncbi:hypothetical protein CSC94_12685 [Zhengella mangrovi]|uniref:Uncharacterized protein n=2 Tax=Zhengella mangrovi TaxID=1982044 RepID=A0A2G1QM62_9HYPH|nr:hypothetical protein CSC94_12685 [Zhengella mangrovi]
MTPDQFSELKTLILDLTIKVEEMKEHLQRQDEAISLLHDMTFEHTAPPEKKAIADALERGENPFWSDTDMPVDVKKLLGL